MSGAAGRPLRPTTEGRSAYVDESFHEHTEGGYYILAAAVLAHEQHDTARQAMTKLRAGRRTDKTHWNEMDRLQRAAAVRRVNSLGGFHVVAVAAPVPVRRQERARALCLKALVPELHGHDVQRLLVEHRTAELNRRDINTVAGARYALPAGSPFYVDHVHARAEPLLWVADIVAGAIRGHREGSQVGGELLTRTTLLDVATDR